MRAASAIRWWRLVNQHGTPGTKRQGGDRRAARIAAHTSFIMKAIERKDDITLIEMHSLQTFSDIFARQPILAVSPTSSSRS